MIHDQQSIQININEIIRMYAIRGKAKIVYYVLCIRSS